MKVKGSAPNSKFAEGFGRSHITRRSLLGAVAAGTAAVATPAFAMAEPTGSKASRRALWLAAQKPQGEEGLVHALNQVAYPDPIASDDYDTLFETLEANGLDEVFLEALAAFANDLACLALASRRPTTSIRTSASRPQASTLPWHCCRKGQVRRPRRPSSCWVPCAPTTHPRWPRGAQS